MTVWRKNKMRNRHWIALLAILSMLVAACGSGTTDGTDSDDGGTDTTSEAPAGGDGDPTEIVFWHVYSGPEEAAIGELVNRFHAERSDIRVTAEFAGGYGDLSQKIASALEAGSPPNVAVGYESDTLRYHTSGRLLDLGEFVDDDTNIDDFFDVELRRNTFLTEDGAHLSFPWTAAVAVLYYNQDLLEAAGFDGPAATWDEFDEQCTSMLENQGHPCYAVAVDPSHFNAMGFPFGESVMDVEAKSTGYAGDGWTEVLELHAQWIDKGYAYPTIGRADVATADINDFASQQVAYIMKSSRFLPFIQEAVADSFTWSMAPPPQPEETDAPITVLFGPNIMAFDAGEEANQASFDFIEYITGPAGQAYWAEVSGNLPTRMSTAETAEYGAYLEANPGMRVAFDLLANAQSEGSLNDEGLVAPMPFALRLLLEDVESELLTGAITVEEAQQMLLEEGDPIVSEYLTSLGY
jgi:ABC-type glycerol-3-phosphate transport system substrate-binding protein